MKASNVDAPRWRAPSAASADARQPRRRARSPRAPCCAPAPLRPAPAAAARPAAGRCGRRSMPRCGDSSRDVGRGRSAGRCPRRRARWRRRRCGAAPARRRAPCSTRLRVGHAARSSATGPASRICSTSGLGRVRVISPVLIDDRASRSALYHARRAARSGASSRRRLAAGRSASIGCGGAQSPGLYRGRQKCAPRGAERRLIRPRIRVRLSLR